LNKYILSALLNCAYVTRTQGWSTSSAYTSTAVLGILGMSPERYLKTWQVARVRRLASDVAHFAYHTYVSVVFF